MRGAGIWRALRDGSAKIDFPNRPEIEYQAFTSTDWDVNKNIENVKLIMKQVGLSLRTYA